MDRNETNFTEHATKRMQQRGIKKQAARIILTHADKEIYVGNGSIALSVSKQRLDVLRQDGQVSPQLADKVNGKCLVVANDNGPDEQRDKVVTVLQIRGKAGRHYRKSCRRNYSRGQKWTR